MHVMWREFVAWMYAIIMTVLVCLLLLVGCTPTSPLHCNEPNRPWSAWCDECDSPECCQQWLEPNKFLECIG
jgi:hypothetical protein